ncbi:hypothetical protein BJ875DRAFT_478620 [Amylocarpus encephaloides]|uniref:Uncharacterized protein n=1 Tax=Amylocarpus encephaloides TaxID=45428 RepID=A0A9P7Y685_9HELO|nr:hypothetical protein BJ875DRAFT_478620 [Amylocarpus encephaloides]
MDNFRKTVPESTEAQKHQAYDNLPAEEKKKQSYSEWVAAMYANQYERWMPWIEDQYLRWFGKGDNKASYATKEQLAKTKVTGISQVDQIQDDVHNLVGNQLGENGILAPIGNIASKEGINRAERQGKEEDGSYGAAGRMGQGARNIGGSVFGGAQSVGGGVADGVKGGAGYLGGMLGGEK